MILCIDIGNTNIKFGAFQKGDRGPIFTARISTEHNWTSDQYATSISDILSINRVETSGIEGSIIASVVPAVTQSVATAVRKLSGIQPMIVGPGIKSGLNIAIESPSLVGSDLIAGCVGALGIQDPPFIVIDTGTIISLCVVDEGGRFIGGSLFPGLKLSMDTMGKNSAQLPSISLDRPSRVIGKNTVECMRSGLMNGFASAIDGLIEKTCEEFGRDVPVIMTGGVSPILAPLCRTKVRLERNLLFNGLMKIYALNQKSE